MPALRNELLIRMTLLATVLAGCSTSLPSEMAMPSRSPSHAPGFSLPTLTEWNGNCAGIAMNSELMGDADDPRVAWVIDADRGRREIVWPPGFSARFTPDLEILDAEGQVIAAEGSKVTGGCVTGLDDHFLLIPANAIGEEFRPPT